MKTLTHLPKEIKTEDGTILRPYVGGNKLSEVIATCKKRGIKYRTVQVLSKNLRGRTDLYGREYRPTKWVFTALP